MIYLQKRFVSFIIKSVVNYGKVIRMETYQALNIGEFYDIEEMKKKNISCWLLYQTDEEKGRSIKLMCSAGARTTIKNVLPETLCYILYEQGEYYKKESLANQVVSYRLNVEQMLLKEGFKISLSEEILDKVKSDPLTLWQALRREDISEIIADDFKGFCVFHPIKKKRYKVSGFGLNEWIEEKRREISVCYRPNTKLLNKVFLEEIFCKINLDEETFDYKQYFANTLEDEKIILNEEESLELYNCLEEYVEKYYLSGKEKCILKKDGNSQTELKEVCFFKKDRGLQTELYYDGDIMKVKDYTTQNLFEWWIGGRLEKQRNKAILLGLLE